MEKISNNCLKYQGIFNMSDWWNRVFSVPSVFFAFSRDARTYSRDLWRSDAFWDGWKLVYTIQSRQSETRTIRSQYSFTKIHVKLRENWQRYVPTVHNKWPIKTSNVFISVPLPSNTMRGILLNKDLELKAWLDDFFQ